MNDYIELRVELTPCTEDITDVLAALLAERGYESFVADGSGLTAYVREDAYDEGATGDAIAALPFGGVAATASHRRVAGRDWNAEWERNYFQPILIDGRCAVHSTFHTDVPAADYDIVIDPKMAFGTGHHQTTTLMMRHLLDTPLQGKSVIDMGTGTGILAILAAMRGAGPVSAVEIDEFAHANALENVALNGHPEVRVILGDATALAGIAPADLLLANINRNIILADLPRYAAALKPGGEMALSGFYSADAIAIAAEAANHGLRPIASESLDDWTRLLLKKP